jgi:hypothetical protein
MQLGNPSSMNYMRDSNKRAYLPCPRTKRIEVLSACHYLPWACGLLLVLRTDGAVGACDDGGGQHPFFLSLAAAIFSSSASSFTRPAVGCCFCSLRPLQNEFFLSSVIVLFLSVLLITSKQELKSSEKLLVTFCFGLNSV